VSTVLWRQARADLRTRRVAAVLLALTAACAALTLSLAGVILDRADEPFERAFDRAHGAHLWAFAEGGALDATTVAAFEDLDGVVGSTGVIERFTRPVDTPAGRADAILERADQPWPVSTPLLADGRWLDPGAGEVVLERSYARGVDAGIGDVVDVVTATGPLPLEVVGIAASTARALYPEVTPGVAWVDGATIDAVAAAGVGAGPVAPDAMIGVRLDDAGRTDAALRQVFTEELRVQLWTWEDAADSITTRTEDFQAVLVSFALFAVIGTALVVANLVGGQVVAATRQVAVLKAVGWTPRQVSRLLVGEQLLVAAIGSVVGGLAGLLVAPLLLRSTAELLAVDVGVEAQPAPVVMAVLVVLAVVAASAGLAARGAGRRPVAAALGRGISGARSRVSLPARLAGSLGLGAVARVGVKDLTAHRLRTVLLVVGLVASVGTVTGAVILEHSSEELLSDHARRAEPWDALVAPLDVPVDEARAEVAATDGVEATLAVTHVGTEVPGMQSFGLLVVDGDVAEFPFRILAGRMVAGPGEVVVGTGLRAVDGVDVGDALSATVSGRAVELTVVGVYADPDDGGRIALVERATVPWAGSDWDVAAQLTPGVGRADLDAALRASTGGALAVAAREDPVEDDVNSFRNVVRPLAGALLLVGLVNLLGTTLLQVRERRRDVAILKALGMTPRQVARSVVLGSLAVVAVGIVVGTPYGVWMLDVMVDAVADPGERATIVTRPPVFWYLLTGVGIALLAAATAAVPARQAARSEVVAALAEE
jgi:putative ABC transport system permease protein